VSELYLLRHAKAVPAGEGGSDRERPLEQKGRHAAQAIGQWIAGHRPAIDLVLCSPSARTRQTLDIVSPAFLRPPRILIEDALYLATARALLARLRQIEDAASVMAIGHNPGFQELAQTLADVSSGPLASRLAGGLPTAALARFELAVPWPSLDRRRARLTALVTPKELLRGEE